MLKLLFSNKAINDLSEIWEYSYDNGSNPYQLGHGNRVKRVGKTVQLKAADTTLTETTVGKFNIRIYPNPTKGQLMQNIDELGDTRILKKEK